MASFEESVDSMQSIDDILKRSHIHFRRYLNFQAISPHLRSHNLLTDDEYEVISKKDTRAQQADELLTCLSHKGRNSLGHLINCLKLSQDHTGHQDILTELKRQMSPIGSDIPVDLCTQDDSDIEDQDKFNKLTQEVNAMYAKEKETVANLKKKLKEKDDEIQQLHFSCDEQLNKIKTLEDTISAMKNDVENLEKELHEKETLLTSMDTCTTNYSDGDLLYSLGEINFDDAEKVQSMQRNIAKAVLCNSLPFISPGSPDPIRSHKRSFSDTRVPKRSESEGRLPIEDKMRAYKRKLQCYQIKYKYLQVQKQLLEDEKISLKAEKHELQSEVHQLKQILEVESISSRKSTVVSKDRTLPSANLQDDAGYNATVTKSGCSVKQETTSEGSYFSRLTSYIISPVKRLSRTQAELVSEQKFEILLPKDIDKEYINPIYQGFLTKEGGIKRNLRKRWCVLTSQYFFYFEGKEDPAAENKRPIGILPITKDMRVEECAKQNWFRVSMESGANITSYKLDKGRTNYVYGNHNVYNLQASSDDDKKKWIKFFQEVIEQLLN